MAARWNLRGSVATGSLASLAAWVELSPVWPLPDDRLEGGARIRSNAKLCAEPQVPAPEIGPGIAREAPKLVRAA